MNDGRLQNTLLKRVHVTRFSQGVFPREAERGRDGNGGAKGVHLFFVPPPPSFSPAKQTDHTFYVARLS